MPDRLHHPRDEGPPGPPPDLPIERAWSAKPGDTVFVRLPKWARPEHYKHARATLDQATHETGVYFVVLAAEVEIVNPKTGAVA